MARSSQDSDPPVSSRLEPGPIAVDPTKWPGEIADFLKFLINLGAKEHDDPPIHGEWQTLVNCVWFYLGELRAGETGIVEYEPGDDTSEKDIAGHVEAGSQNQDQNPKTVGKGARFVNPGPIWVHLKLPEGDHVHGCKARLNVYPAPEEQKK